MIRSSLTLFGIIKVVAILLFVANFSSAQDRNKERDSPEHKVLGRLHPDLNDADPLKGINLLTGYKHKAATDFEGNQVREISKSDGIRIKYEIGLSQGMAVDPDRKTVYIWYREQKVSGRITRYALSKDNVLMISVSLSSEPNSLHAANF